MTQPPKLAIRDKTYQRVIERGHYFITTLHVPKLLNRLLGQSQLYEPPLFFYETRFSAFSLLTGPANSPDTLDKRSNPVW